jgi:hypothetical protein
MVLYVIYTLILIYITAVLAIEFYHEKNWKIIIAMSFVLLVFVLRILQIK